MATSNKRATILRTAETCLYEKDYAKTTISEIAKRSGVTASVLYHYYKNKEDLFFSVIGKRLEEINRDLSDHLQGIIDPFSQLKKIIWFHLNYFNSHPEWSRLFMFDGLRNRDFYFHPAYQNLRRYSSFIIAALLEGIEKGIFRKDLNTAVTRDLIGGIMDNQVLTWLILDDIDNMTEAVDGIMDLLIPALTQPADNPDRPLGKKERINLAAGDLFSEKGYEKTTMLDIAKRVGIAEGSVYDYYKNKDEILLSVTEAHLTLMDQGFKDLFTITDPLKKLERLIRVYFTNNLTNREFLKTYFLQLFFSDRFWDLTSFKANLESGYGVQTFLEDGIATGVFRPEIDSRALRSVIVGGLGHMAFRWVFVEGEVKQDPRKSDKTRDIDDAVSMIIRMVAAARLH